MLVAGACAAVVAAMAAAVAVCAGVAGAAGAGGTCLPLPPTSPGPQQPYADAMPGLGEFSTSPNSKHASKPVISSQCLSKHDSAHSKHAPRMQSNNHAKVSQMQPSNLLGFVPWSHRL